MTRVRLLALALVTLMPLVARGQGSPALGQPPGGTIGQEEPKKEGVAEKAPKEQTQLPTLPPLPPYPGQDVKKFEMMTLDGYFRVRANWMDNFHLGFHDTGQGTPFREPLTCRDRPDLTNNGQPNPFRSGACSSAIGSTNMRVRLEPTIHLSETVALHMQVDALDNLVLGSTPDGVTLDGSPNAPNLPVGTYTSNQVTPEPGKNSPWSSIRFKRAWADVTTPLGSIQFGRMPNQWGLGILANAGGYDWIHGTTCLDCDYGDNVDRFMIGGAIPGTPLRAAIAVDWASSVPTSAQLDAWRNRYDGQPYDMDDSDDVTQYTVMLTHIDDPLDWNLAVREGRTMLNYGAYFVYRSQQFQATPLTLGEDSTLLAAKSYQQRNSKVYIPDIWGRFTTDKLIIEAEAVGVFGWVDDIYPDAGKPPWNITQFGAVLKLDYLMLNDDLDLGFELGYASGDQWENNPSGIINVHDAYLLPPKDFGAPDQSINLTAFRFNFDYRVDMILFKELLGTVTNATYAKPSLRYNITERFAFKAAAIMSFANVPVSTPGNSSVYGIELNGDLGYSNVKEGFFAGLSYGVLFPLGALDHPTTISEFGTEANPGASTAQTFQARFVLKF
jgi:uncharacterized protein (TIGR04551 family)